MSGRKPDGILSPVALRAMSQSLSLAATVLGFDIVELWSDAGDGKLHCTFVHANEDVIAKYPNVIFGYYPDHQRDHKLSPLVRTSQIHIQLKLYMFFLLPFYYLAMRNVP
ncbi:hypothetical protein EON65_29515 [archaeon]|nr:MAG: hypothetical protein EON65_29515 [archaeon]